jgi:structural maintenance of chromosome 3 (chondroitin sulfate proteoglycan 6)
MLALLKEVAGTKVYEQRRSESLRIMDDISARRQKINELLDYIDGRLAELDEEEELLKEYQGKDRERRCVECVGKRTQRSRCGAGRFRRRKTW